MSSLQQRLATVTELQLAAIGTAALLKSQLSELEGLRERVRKALQFPAPETAEFQVSNLKSTMKMRCGQHRGSERRPPLAS